MYSICSVHGLLRKLSIKSAGSTRCYRSKYDMKLLITKLLMLIQFHKIHSLEYKDI